MKFESELIFALRNSDRKALSVIYDRFYQDLYFYLLKFSSQEDLVQNAIHDIFLELWRSRKSLGEIHSLKAYLLISCRRKLFKLIKSSQPCSKNELVDQDSHSEILFQYSHEDFLIDEEIGNERQKNILKAIDQLSAKQKEIIYLRYYENLSIEEIGAFQGIAYQSVLNNLQRSYQSLRDNPLLIELLKVSPLVLVFHFIS